MHTYRSRQLRDNGRYEMRITINLDGYDVANDIAKAAQVVASAWISDRNADVRIKGINKKDKENVWYSASRLFETGVSK